MYLLALHNGPWKVVAPLLKGNDGRYICPVQIELTSLAYAYQKQVAGLVELFKRIDRTGPLQLSTNLFHCVDTDKNIYQFIKGDLRLFCFMTPKGSICVCTTVVVKKGRKADKSAVQNSRRIRKDVLEALDKQTVSIVTETEELNKGMKP